MSKVVFIAARNNHTLVLQNLGDKENPRYRLRAMGDNMFGQLGNFEKMKYADPIDIETDYRGDLNVNGISLGKKIENGVPVIEAFGLYSIEEQKRGENENQEDISNYKVAQLITTPTVVKARSFNEFIERYGSLTHYLVDASESPSLLDDPALEPLIDEANLTRYQFLSDGQKPVAGMMSIHYGTKYEVSLLSDSSVGGSITIGSLNQGLIESEKNRPPKGILQKIIK